jgi:hypothetical protein
MNGNAGSACGPCNVNGGGGGSGAFSLCFITYVIMYFAGGSIYISVGGKLDYSTGTISANGGSGGCGMYFM